MQTATKNQTLKQLRQKRGWTQGELGRRVGVTQEYISQLERGRMPGMVTARKLAALFDTTVDALFLDSQNKEFGDSLTA